MHATRRVKLKDISPNLTCHLCQGYFIDATTIIECLHSFCRSCIVQHLEKSEYCPVCDVQLHSSKPLSSIRSDHMLQEIVYKLVPGLFQNEMSRRRKYYKEESEVKPLSQQDAGHVFNESYITSDDIIHLSLELQTDQVKIRETSKRYIKCPAAVSISILKKLLQGKYDLNGSTSIDILYRDRTLPDDFLLMDIAYKYFWSQNDGKPLQLCYKFKGYKPEISKPYKPLPAPTVTSTPNRRKSITTKTKFNTTPSSEPTPKNPKQTPVPKSQAATPLNGKLARGRPKRKLSIEPEDKDNIIGKSEEKKPKKIKMVKEKVPGKQSKKSLAKEKLKLNGIEESNGVESAVAEVQLRISENGVISATSVSSGEEKIIVKNPVPLVATSPTILSAYPHNFNGKTPSPTPELMKRHGATNGTSNRHNGNHDSSETTKKYVSPEKTNKSPDFNPWKFTPEDLTRKPGNGILNLDSLSREKEKHKTPPKRHQTTIVNGNFKFTPIISPSPSKNNGSPASSPKKPPKFFKSRHTEMKTTGTETNGDINGKSHSPSPLKFPENGATLKIPSHGKLAQLPQTTPETRSTSSGPSFTPSPSILDHFASGFRFPMNMNMNLGLGNNVPMNLVPFVTSNYCSMPFYNGNRPAISNNALMANALAMMSNPQYYPAFQAQANNSNNSNRQQGNSSPSTNTSLDLSMSNRKPVSSYVQISPKKSQKESTQKEPLSLKMKSPKSPVKRDKERKMPKKSPIVPQNGPSKVTNSPDKTPVPVPLSTISTDALDFCHSVSKSESDPDPVPEPLKNGGDEPCDKSDDIRPATPDASVKAPPEPAMSPPAAAASPPAAEVTQSTPETTSPEDCVTVTQPISEETRNLDVNRVNVNLNSPSSSFSPTNNNNNNPTPKLEPMSEPMDVDVDCDHDRLVISECDTSLPTSTNCAQAVSVNVISSSKTSSA